MQEYTAFFDVSIKEFHLLATILINIYTFKISVRYYKIAINFTQSSSHANILNLDFTVKIINRIHLASCLYFLVKY